MIILRTSIIIFALSFNMLTGGPQRISKTIPGSEIRREPEAAQAAFAAFIKLVMEVLDDWSIFRIPYQCDITKTIVSVANFIARRKNRTSVSHHINYSTKLLIRQALFMLSKAAEHRGWSRQSVEYLRKKKASLHKYIPLYFWSHSSCRVSFSLLHINPRFASCQIV